MSEIRTLFQQDIHRRIEKVIQYQATAEDRLRQEISEYQVTPNVESVFERLLDVLDEGFNSGGSQEIGVWVSGFYGSGKSSITKYLGYALDHEFTLGETRFRDLLKNRIGSVKVQSRLITVESTHKPAVVLIDLSTAQSGSNTGEPVSSIVFRRVLTWAGYSQITKHALFELQCDEDGRQEEMLDAVRRRDRDWMAIRNNEVVGGGVASQVAQELYPDVFPNEKSFENLRVESLDMVTIVNKILNLVERRRGHRKLIVILDEAGHYVAPQKQLVTNLQGLAQNFKELGNGHLWLIATAQQTLTDTVDPANAPILFQLKDRFQVSFELKADDITEITHRRLLEKSTEGREALQAIFNTSGDKLKVHTRLENAKGYPPKLNEESFVQLYPFLPQHFDLMMNIIARLARSTGGTGLRSAIKVVQETLIGVGGGTAFASRSLGSLVTIVDFFDVLRQDLENAVSYKHVTESVDKAVKRYGPDSPETRVAKGVAVMQLLDDFPLTRANLAALLVDHVDAGVQAEMIEAAVDTLQQDTTIPLEELDGRLWFLSDRSADLQRQWREIQPNTHEYRQKLADVIRDTVMPHDPKAQIHGNKQIRGKLILNARGSTQTLGSASAEVDVELRLVPESEFQSARTEANQESVTPAADTRIVALAGVRGALETSVRDAFACSKMQSQLRATTRDADETEFLQSMEDRGRNAARTIDDSLRVALESGSVIYRGQDIAVTHGAGSFSAALSIAMTAVGEELFDRYPHAAISPNPAAAERIVKARDTATITAQEDPLNLLSGGTGGLFHAAHPAVRDILDHVNQRGSVDGKTLLDSFSNRPYGWNKDVTRYVIAAMFVASQISLRVNGTLYTTTAPPVIEAFKSNTSFAKVGLDAPPAPPDQNVLHAARSVLTELTGTTVQPIPAKLEAAGRELLPAAITAAGEARARAAALQLPVTQTLADARSELETVKESSQDGLLRAFADSDRILPDRILFVRKTQELLHGPFGETISRVQQRLARLGDLTANGTYRQLHEEIAPLREEIRDLLAQNDLKSVQPKVQQLEDDLTAIVKHACDVETASLLETMAAQADQIELSPQWNNLPPVEQERLASRLAELRDPAVPADSDPFDRIEALYAERFNRLSLVVALQDAVHKADQKESVVPEERTGARMLTVPAPALSRMEAVARLTQLLEELAGLDEDTTVQFRVGE